MPPIKKILIISHDASRTGAPILLLNLTRAIKSNSVYEVSFLLKRSSGGLFKEFNALSSVSIASKQYKFESIFKRLYFDHFLGNKFSEGRIKNALKDVDLVLSNTITNGDLLPYIKKYFKGPILSYIHELKMATNYFTNPKDLENLVKCTDHYLVPSMAVKAYLSKSLHIQDSRIDLLSYYIPESTVSLTDGDSDTLLDNEDLAFVVGAAGTTDWRKGPELFIAVAVMLFERLPRADIKFFWKGSMGSGLELERLQYDVNKAGLTGRVIFLPATSEMESFYNKLDLFILTSHEDPYPLVVLEAAKAAIPSICFKEAGGAEEFVCNDAGIVINYLNLQEMVEAVIYYYNNHTKRKEHGLMAKNKLYERHQRPEIIIRQLDSIFSKLYKYGKK